jgi:uncharacterized repeat protein (TIGR03803 family)
MKFILRLLFLCVAAAVASCAQTFTTVASFNGTDGNNPDITSLIQSVDGNFYGTTGDGGDDRGNVFEMTPDGALTTLYSFCSEQECEDGEAPTGLILGADGNFYGTTQAGGATNGNGTVFKLTRQGILTTLHSFCSETGCADGQYPYSLVQGADGSFYGVTQNGGSGGVEGYGTVFKITSQGTLTTMHTFDLLDGADPTALMEGADGNFYGTTEGGGGSNGNGDGTVFSMTRQGALTTLYSFCAETDCADGEAPVGGLIQSGNGSFYGVTFRGGTFLYGTVFKITASGTETTLHSFDLSDGSYPDGALVQATDGNLYGTTGAGGTHGFGTIFKITSDGVLTTLHNFDGGDGEEPGGGMSQATNGIVYGTTELGGRYTDGTVFSLDVGAASFIQTIPTVGRIGENVTILGNGLKGSTSVSFNGTPATTFTASNTSIKVTVPTGATTGTVEVTTATGETLKSNVVFRIKP